MSNRTFFKSVEKDKMSFGDIFSDVAKKHTRSQTAKVFIAGTDLTTPSERDMLSGWQKPFLFARFLLGMILFVALTFILTDVLGMESARFYGMISIPFIVPVTLLLLIWEMNIPRNISLYEVLGIVFIGGMLSLIFTLLFQALDLPDDAIWAGLTEEPAKLLVVYLVLRKKNYKYAINGMLLGAAVGVGFSVLETLLYACNSFIEGTVLGVAEALESGDVDYVLTYATIFGLESGVNTAVVRALTALSGHVTFAALYGYALAKEKGSDELQLAHLFRPEFLLYFALSILLHALHNYGLDFGLPVVFGVPLEYMVLAVVCVILLLFVLRKAVSQVVKVALAYNNESVTQAVVRNNAAGMPAAAAASSDHAYQLECTAGPMVGQTFRVNGSLTIGRSAGKNDIALPAAQNVSSSHCRISVSGGRITVTDLNSTNGTFLNGQRLMPNQPMPANSGDEMWLGDRRYAFRIR